MPQAEKTLTGGGRLNNRGALAPYARKDGSLTHEHFQLREARLVAGLRLDGLSDDEIVELAKRDNIFQFPTQTQIGSMARSLLNRLDALESERLVAVLAHGMPEEAAQVNLYAMMRVFNVIRAFMVDEIGMRYRTLDYTFTLMDANAFITRYQTENADAATWSDSTITRIRSVLTECLVSAGYLENAQSTDLRTVFIDPDLQDVMEANGDAAWLPAFNCLAVM